MAYYIVNDRTRRIEIHFASKPSFSIREIMKNNGWRWHGYEKYWYNSISDINKEVAQEICDLDNGAAPKKEIVEKVANKEVYVAPNPFPVKPVFYEGEDIEFEDNGVHRFGTISALMDDEALVKYATYLNNIRNYHFTWVPLELIKKTKYWRRSSNPADGWAVDYERDDGAIAKGVVIADSYSGFHVVTFEVSETGSINKDVYHFFPTDRILEVEYYSAEDILPLKAGDRVEYTTTSGEHRVGKMVRYESNYDVIVVEYVEIDAWKERYTWYDRVGIESVTKLTGLRKKLRREDYIDAALQSDIQFNEGIKERIRERDTFSEAISSEAKKPLFKHQLAGCVLAEKYNKFAFFYDTGTGKTVMALNIVESKYKREGIRFLIIAPKSIIKTAWLDDAANFYPGMRILPLYKGFDAYKKKGLFRAWRTGKSRSTIENDKVFLAHMKFLAEVYGYTDPEDYTKAQIDEFLESEAQHYIINSELFIANPEKYISGLGITGLIMDESAIMKNYDSKTAKTIREVSSNLKYVYLLSGKPAPNNEMEFFSQMKVVAPELFGFSYNRFLATFCMSQGRKMVLNPENRDLFAEMVSAKSLIISKKDCLDLPDTVEVVRLIELPDDVMDDYDALYRECMVFIKGMDESSIFYSTQSRMAILMKLRQMASGFFMQKTEYGVENKVIIDIHRAKINEVLSIIDEIPDEQIIIWCQFQHEIELLEKELSKIGPTVTAYGKTKTLEENIDDFKHGRAKYILAHPKTLKYGVTFTNCKYAIYYSFSYSAEDYDQSHDRNYRLGQTESCTYFFLQAADTIDEIMYSKVMNKLTNAEFFEQLVKDAEKHGIDYSTLKGESDERIKSELSKQDSSSGLQDMIVERSEKREQERIRAQMEAALDSKVSRDDFLDVIPEPTSEELYWLERSMQRWNISNVIEDTDFDYEEESLIDNRPILPNSLVDYESDYDDDFSVDAVLSSIAPSFEQLYAYDNFEFDYSRLITFDGLLDEETEDPDIELPNEPEELQILLSEHPTKERWIADMYCKVFHALERLPSLNSEIIRLKYGLSDGIKRANTTVSDAIYSYYDSYEDRYYRCNASIVAQGLQEGLEQLRENGELDIFVERVKSVLGFPD